MTNLEIGEVVMCTVERIDNTIIFVKIDGDGQGSIILSEIAPGRIRNLRDYVIPKKRIICKVLRIRENNIELSLRRVTLKEQKEIKEKYQLEKNYTSILKTVLKEKAEKTIEEILNKEKIYDFLEEAKINSLNLEKLVGKEDSKKILDILKTQKQKEVSLKKEFGLTTTSPNGITIIKQGLEEIKEMQITYLSAGKYSIKTTSENLKSADKLLHESLEKIEKLAKKQGMEFTIKER